LCVLAIYLIANILLAGSPAWIVRRDQRKKVMVRVEAAGGWTALQHACDGLVESNRESRFDWAFYRDTNGLPPAIAALQPQEVSFDSSQVVHTSISDREPVIVHIKIFGIHRSGLRAIPYYGLEFVSGTNADRYTPRPSEGAVSGNGYDSYRKITNRIYEIYGPD
jgi:hypothetical protein